jgi:protease secretion system membrane fusion protein
MNAPESRRQLSAPAQALGPEPSGAASGQPLKTSHRGPLTIGLLLLGAGVVGFSIWGLTAPLDEAVTAIGTVVVSDYRKTVQAPSAGKIAEIRVREGDSVEQGQVLVVLDAAKADAEVEQVRAQWIAAMAAQARLRAEHGRSAGIAMPAELAELRTDPRTVNAMAQQQELFRSRRSALEAELGAMRQTIETLAGQTLGTQRVIQANEEQLRLLEEQLGNERKLADEGFLPKNRLLEQQRIAAQIRAGIAEGQATQARLESQQSEQKARMLQRREEFRRDADRELADVQRDAESMRKRIEALSVEQRNTEITAPVSGKVVGLAVHTVGGVVQPAAALMDVVPLEQPLRIDAQVSPTAIDRVRVGLPVQMMLTAFNQATTPRVPGQVVTVAADATIDPLTRMPAYKVLVEVTEEGKGMLKGLELKPGMPAEVFVVTGERTFFQYLIRPITDRLRGSFTER